MAYKPFSRLPKKDKLRTALERFNDAVAADSSWQTEATEAFAFAAGHQWTETEKAVLTQENRPALVWNYIKPDLDLVMGLVEQNRVKAAPYPIEKSDQILCDVLDSISDVIDNEENTQQKEDEAFYDAITCGRGYVAIDANPDPRNYGEIRIQISNVPVYEIRLDPSGNNDDLSDHRYIFREKWLSREDFRRIYPESAKYIENLLDHGDLVPLEDKLPDDSASVFPDDQTDADDLEYTKPLDYDYYSKNKDRIRVIHMEYWETYPRYYALNPMSGKVEEISEQSIPTFKEQFPDSQIEVLNDKKVRWLQFCKDKILYDGDSPLPIDGFSIIPIFAYKDKSKKTISHFGIVHLLKDPQREVNKRWSQALNLLVHQGQGIMAETDAFVDVDQAEETWNDPRRITWITRGAIANGKIQEKPGIVFPAASMEMQEMAHQAMRHISGINPDLMGFDRGRQDAGIVVRLRQQQGLTLLSKLFSNYKEMKKRLFYYKSAIIMKFMPDNQITKIIGQADRYVIQDGLIIDTVAAEQWQQIQQQNAKPMPIDMPTVFAPLRDLRNLRYNVKIEECPGNMTKEMLELSIYMEMMSRNFPVDPKMVIDKMNLPGKQKARWMQYIDSQQQIQQQTQQAIAQTQIQLEQAKLQLEQAKLEITQQVEASKLQLEQARLQNEAKIEELKLVLQAQKAGADIELNRGRAALTSQRIAGDQKIAEAKLLQADAKANLDAQLKAKALLNESQHNRDKIDIEDRRITFDALSKLGQKAQPVNK